MTKMQERAERTLRLFNRLNGPIFYFRERDKWNAYSKSGMNSILQSLSNGNSTWAYKYLVVFRTEHNGDHVFPSTNLKGNNPEILNLFSEKSNLGFNAPFKCCHIAHMDDDDAFTEFVDVTKMANFFGAIRNMRMCLRDERDGENDRQLIDLRDRFEKMMVVQIRKMAKAQFTS